MSLRDVICESIYSNTRESVKKEKMFRHVNYHGDRPSSLSFLEVYTNVIIKLASTRLLLIVKD